MDYSLLEDKELYDKLERAALANKLKSSNEWKLLEEARKRIVERAVCEFATRTDVTDIAKLTELKVIIKKYKYGLFSELDLLIQEGELAFHEYKNREMLNTNSNPD
ncbi:MAG: hypothetical protein ACE5GV_11610 [Candidatus Scalindua sp.]